jgi:LPXTG-motif cell wall-anchored protein
VAKRDGLRPHATRTAAVLGGALLGLTVAFPATAAFAADAPPASDPGPATAATPAPDLPVDPPVGAADTTSTSTTTTTTRPAGPPATVVLIPPLVEDFGPPEVGDAATASRERTRVRARPRVATPSGPTLPLTGDSSFSVLAAGLGALAIGGAAVWWGSRRADPSEAAKPPARG